MAKSVASDALTQIIESSAEETQKVEKKEYGSKCRCGAAVKCSSCGESPSECDC